MPGSPGWLNQSCERSRGLSPGPGCFAIVFLHELHVLAPGSAEGRSSQIMAKPARQSQPHQGNISPPGRRLEDLYCSAA
jgi:hypothetical protein